MSTLKKVICTIGGIATIGGAVELGAQALTQQELRAIRNQIPAIEREIKQLTPRIREYEQYQNDFRDRHLSVVQQELDNIIQTKIENRLLPSLTPEQQQQRGLTRGNRQSISINNKIRASFPNKKIFLYQKSMNVRQDGTLNSAEIRVRDLGCRKKYERFSPKLDRERQLRNQLSNLRSQYVRGGGRF